METIMARASLGVISALLLACGTAQAHADEAKGQLGRVKFTSSCDARVQPLLETGVAMLHSFWYSATEKTFRDVLAQDPSCTIANWGIAAILMQNPLAGTGASPKGAAARRSCGSGSAPRPGARDT